MFERAELGNRAILVHMDTSDEERREDLSEFVELVTSAGAEILHTATSSRHTPDPKYFIGKGQAAGIKQRLTLYFSIMPCHHHRSETWKRFYNAVYWIAPALSSIYLLSVHAPLKASCKSSLRNSSTCLRDWSGAGPTSSARKVALA